MPQKEHLKAKASPTTADLHWIAGFMDGEGTFGNGGHVKYPCAAVSATQKDIEPLEKLQKFLGGSIGKNSNNTTTGSKRYFYRWQATGPRARGIMMTLYPLLSSRRQTKIREVLS